MENSVKRCAREGRLAGARLSLQAGARRCCSARPHHAAVRDMYLSLPLPLVRGVAATGTSPNTWCTISTQPHKTAHLRSSMVLSGLDSITQCSATLVCSTSRCKQPTS